MLKKRCARGTCNSDSCYSSEDFMTGVTFRPSPKPKIQLEKCREWITLCNLPHTDDKIGANLRDFRSGNKADLALTLTLQVYHRSLPDSDPSSSKRTIVNVAYTQDQLEGPGQVPRASESTQLGMAEREREREKDKISWTPVWTTVPATGQLCQGLVQCATSQGAGIIDVHAGSQIFHAQHCALQ
ncbi:hypothetical protein PoB_003329300 [Plakobranchus ocellatus]|uniref:Uncharacterized protein n=1 Tax=Plakobranchus ocellatus TaxID=259542 RepID=A0AAV4AHR0_9GAST|nr:hypothetical protein PoB_003329300 [Plakobranchus ocellatus]